MGTSKEKPPETFCVVPFTMLSARPNGYLRPCSEILLNHCEAKNFNEVNSFDEIWNGEFMRKLRLDMLNNVPRDLCRVCYYHDRVGVRSKRVYANSLLREKSAERIREASLNLGRVSQFPEWWELRLSSHCNLGCRTCSPRNSTRFGAELSDHQEEIPVSLKDRVNHAISDGTVLHPLSDNEKFMALMLENIAMVEVLELHGGEPYLNSKLWKFLGEVVDRGHAGRITIYSHTNLMQISDQQLATLNQFKGGRFNVSIDAFGSDNEFLRWHSDWKTIERNLLKVGRLHSGFKKFVGTTVSAYSACKMDIFFEWFDRFLEAHPEIGLNWMVWPAAKPEMFQVEIAPYDLRMQTVAKLKLIRENAFSCTRYAHAETINRGLDDLMSLLESKKEPTSRQTIELVDYSRMLDRIRSQNTLETFPHLRSVFEWRDQVSCDISK